MRSTPLLLLTSLALITAPPASSEDGFETATVLYSEDVLTDELVESPHHRVGRLILNDGYMNHYQVEFDFGEMVAHGTLDLQIYIREFEAIDTLSDLSRTEVFIDAMKQSAVKPYEAAQRVIRNPVGTLKGVPDGVARLFRRTARTIEDASDKAKEEYEEFKEDRDQKRSEAAASDEAADGDRDAEKKSTVAKVGGTVDDVLDEGGRYAKRHVGFDRARRQWAKQLGVDPYSRNWALQEALGRVAWATAAGGFTAKVTIPRFEILGHLREVDGLVWELDALDLRIHNEKILSRMGIAGTDIEAFYDNRAYSHTQRTVLTAALDRLDGIEGRDELFAASAAVDNSQAARYMVRSLELLVGLHEGPNPLRKVIAFKPAPVALTDLGDLVAALPVDHLLWTSEFATGVDAFIREVSPEPVSVWVAGACSDRTRGELSARGWRLREGAFGQLASSG